MGNSGSYTSKATINPNFFVFTKWGQTEMQEFLHRGQEELAETFALRRHEFDFLVGQELVDFPTARALFSEIFDTDRNGLVDKFEVMAVVCLTSKLSNKQKVHFFFDLFNFNRKGYLYDSELTLLILAISRGVFKADQKYIPPSNKAIAMLVQEAKLHMILDKDSIRKPELVKFCLGNRDVLSFLESWRGHASQVLLPEKTNWRDLSFPASACSIAPNREWLKLGMPPEEFIHWRRPEKVGNELGCLHLFTHEVSFLKTVDRRLVYQGEGVIGGGYLKQGMISDRWLLNALAAMVAKPDTIAACIAMTGQEKNGRYCCRFYEGGGWRSVNVDDRIPCGPDFNPLFATSSHSMEFWPLILEKGMAKYLGSFGNLAKCGERGDATLTGLRLLTGGHVQQIAVSDLHWSSANDDQLPSEGMQRGAQFVSRILSEGSLISFGRSDPMALMSRKLPVQTAIFEDMIDEEATKKTQHNIPPFGRLFPVVGSMYIKNFNYLILRDGYDIINDADPGVNFETGHSRTFMLKVEDIPSAYDTIMVSRYPDALRPMVDKLRINPWFTEFAFQDTGGVEKPAAFTLELQRGDASTTIVTNPVRKMGDRLMNLTAVLNHSDGKGPTELDKIMTLKEKIDFSRVKMDKNAYQEAKKKNQKNSVEQSGSSPAKINDKNDNEDVPEELIEVCFTISSSCDWKYAGSPEAGAKLLVRLTPDIETRRRWERRELLMEQYKKRIAAENAARIAAAQKLLEELNADEDDEDSTAQYENNRQKHATAVTVNPQVETNSPIINSSRSTAQVNVPPKPERFDIIFTAGRSWLSQSVHLLPGKYFIFADVSFDVPYEHAFNMTLPQDLSDAPWLDGKNPENYINRRNDKLKDFTRAKRSDVQHVESKSIVSITDESVHQDEAAMRLQSNDTKKDLSELPRVWFQASCVEPCAVHAARLESVPPIIDVSLANFLDQIKPELWPFSAESQCEASSSCLINMLAKAKRDAQLVGLEFMHLAAEYKEMRKAMLYH